MIFIIFNKLVFCNQKLLSYSIKLLPMILSVTAPGFLDLRQHLGKCTHQLVDILLVEDYWRLYLQYVCLNSVSTHQNIPLTHHCDYFQCSLSVLLFCLLTFYNIYALEQPNSSHISHKIVLSKCFKFFSQISTCISCILLEFLVLYNFQYSSCGCNSQWISSKSTEILNSSSLIALSYLFCAYDSRYRESITHSLPNYHYIRYNPIIFKSPKIFPYSSKTSLHLISNAYNTLLF